MLLIVFSQQKNWRGKPEMTAALGIKNYNVNIPIIDGN